MALAVDATAHGHQDSAGTVSATITTTGPSLILAFGMSQGLTSISGGGLAWNFLVQGGTSSGKIDIYYAESAGALVAQVITFDPQDGYINLDLVSITGYDTGNLFDDNATNPEISTDGGDLVISTDLADTIIVASFGMSDTAAPSTTSGFTVDSSAHFQLTEHKIVTVTQSSLTFGPGSGNDHGGACVAVRAAAGATREQEGYRWRDDDGSETTASWLVSQDTDISRTKDTVTRLRTLIDVTGDAPSEAVTLQYRKVGAGSWRDVPGGI